jgi:hypothetical protein
MTSFFLVFFDPGKRMVISGPGYRRGEIAADLFGRRGRQELIKNFAPLPKPSLSARIVPQCISTMALLTATPSPRQFDEDFRAIGADRIDRAPDPLPFPGNAPGPGGGVSAARPE